MFTDAARTVRSVDLWGLDKLHDVCGMFSEVDRPVRAQLRI